MVTEITDVIKDQELTMENKDVKPDYKKGRVVLPKNLVPEGITFRVYHNNDGQIILDPQVTIPASEVWLFNNPDALASVRRGLSDVAQGKVSRIDLNTL